MELVRIGTTSMTFDFEVWGQEFRQRPCRWAARGRYVTAHSNRDHLNGAASTPWPEEWIATEQAGVITGLASTVLPGMGASVTASRTSATASRASVTASRASVTASRMSMTRYRASVARSRARTSRPYSAMRGTSPR
ncbi:hypothetical protein ACFYWH_34995 [Streptomyces sp. NPDC003737]|uniref:hypothetical protein n=1 Tax=Streptomyces sp. NPDC003737 TaxID=3364685 RepID=UPI0036C3BB0B